MQISSRFTVALHIFTCAEFFRDRCRVTSEFLSASIHTNPALIRKIVSQLKDAGLLSVARGTGGIAAARPLREISFYDVYRAIEPLEGGKLFRFHPSPSEDCPVGRNIHALLDAKLDAIQDAMENEMKKTSLAELADAMRELSEQEDGTVRQGKESAT